MAYFKAYREHRFNGAAQRTLAQANAILDEYTAQGYKMTLRQLYYQMVARDLIPNQQREYKRLGRILTNAREAGYTDWRAIEDAGRNCYGPTSEEDVENVLDGLQYGISFDYWRRQPHYLEVWVEKQALESVIQRPCDRHDVRYMACKGFLSASEAWRAGLRFQRAFSEGKQCHLIHLADHDPSGMAMTKDNRDRLRTFAEFGVDVRRIALNMDQVEEYSPPPNPAKESDSRFAEYREIYGTESWELDALTPGTIDDLIEGTILEFKDPDIWEQTRKEEEQMRDTCGLAQLAGNWDRIREFMEEEGMI